LAKGLFAGAILGSAALVAMSLTALQPRHAAASLPAFSDGPALQAARQSLRESKTIPSSWIVIADAMARHGQFGDAAKVLLGAVEKEPNNPEAWLALGDALYAHGRGLLSPAAMLAYDRADEATVRGGKPPLLVVAAFERSGRAYLAGNWLQRRANPPPPPSHDIAPAPPCC
jgi:cytochrome c-type biogenesis protein CcmH